MTIGPFEGEYRWLSNFWPAEIIFEGHLYPSVEHAYVASKTLNEMEREVIRSMRSPGEAKRLGRQLDLRDDWNTVRIPIMEDLVRKKFSNIHLAGLLLQTGDKEIIEINSWNDTFWGQCNGKGSNHLGKILMKIRGEHKDWLNSVLSRSV